MIPVVTPAEMAAIDAAATETVETLIGRAGVAVAHAARRMLASTYGRVVNVIAGKGNSGADGRVAGDLLAAAGATVHVFEAAACPTALPPADLVIDAAYGTGFHGDWAAPNVSDARVLAVDIPSGVDGLTGVAVAGVLQADQTVTFAAIKPVICSTTASASPARSPWPTSASTSRRREPTWSSAPTSPIGGDRVLSARTSGCVRSGSWRAVRG